MIQSKTNPDEYFFGLMPDEHKETSAIGDQYYFSIVVDDEGMGEGSFTIQDNCDRFMPFDFSQLSELVTVLTTLLMAVENAQSSQ